MTWNYRIIKHEENNEFYYMIHEVFYNNKGKSDSWTKEGIAPFGETLFMLKKDYKQMAEAFSHPVLEIKKNKLVEIKT